MQGAAAEGQSTIIARAAVASDVPSAAMKRYVATLTLALLLAGCGGGIYLGWSDDDPPSVSLAAGSTSAAPGQSVQLAAAASDDDYVTEVDFYRIDPNGNTVFLGYDTRGPYDWTAVMPPFAAGNVVHFFARAVDSAGQWTDSETVAVTVN